MAPFFLAETISKIQKTHIALYSRFKPRNISFCSAEAQSSFQVVKLVVSKLSTVSHQHAPLVYSIKLQLESNIECAHNLAKHLFICQTTQTSMEMVSAKKNRISRVMQCLINITIAC